MLSVICPIYNEEKYIGKCIESIVAQDFPKNQLEVIFADGMSTDLSLIHNGPHAGDRGGVHGQISLDTADRQS